MTDNVVDFNLFAKKREKEEETHLNELIKQFETKHQLYTEISLTATHEVCEVLMELGIPVDENGDCIKDILTISEGIKSLIYRALGEEYKFQDVCDTVVQVDNSEELLEDFLFGEE